jgi:uncharacterized membrane protein
MEHRSDSELIDRVLDWVEYFSVAIEVLAVAVIVVAVTYATASFLAQRYGRRGTPGAAYTLYRRRIGEALLLGLEILVAADIVRTVILDPTLESVAVLGVLVLIRTFLTWSLVVEMEGRWPWRRPVPSAES